MECAWCVHGVCVEEYAWHVHGVCVDMTLPPGSQDAPARCEKAVRVLGRERPVSRPVPHGSLWGSEFSSPCFPGSPS